MDGDSRRSSGCHKWLDALELSKLTFLLKLKFAEDILVIIGFFKLYFMFLAAYFVSSEAFASFCNGFGGS